MDWPMTEHNVFQQMNCFDKFSDCIRFGAYKETRSAEGDRRYYSLKLNSEVKYAQDGS